ncbi:MAG: S8/S53 family peptidase [Pseudomonadales bacterium]|nr:S8/S53 family peptidase [Pseudomonadales bacterium]
MFYHRTFKVLISLLISALLIGCESKFDPNEVRKSGQRHLEITVALQDDWVNPIALDTLSRRIVGLNWSVYSVPESPNTFEVWPVPNLEISDDRLFQVARMFELDPWVLTATPIYEDPNHTPESEEVGQLPHDDPQWYMGPNGINAYEAWEMFNAIGKKPGEGVLIGLPDTGYFEHPELFHADGTTQLRLDLQRNFYEADKPYDAHDFCNTFCGLTLNKTYKLAYAGHGTTTASMIISPSEKNPETVGYYKAEGAAPYSEVIPIRITPTVLLTPITMSYMAEAINYSVAQGAKVISVSLGGFADDGGALHDTIKAAQEAGVIVVAAAGNGPWGVGLPLIYFVAKPAIYPETIAVCGSNAEEQPWKDSSNGSAVDICAPAENIRRARSGWINLTEHVKDTDQSEGTSMSTALTAGVAALWISYHGYDNLVAFYGGEAQKVPEAFKEILNTVGHRRPDNWNTYRYGSGIIDAAKVLQAPLPEL